MNEMIEHAKQLAEARSYEQAIALLREVLARDPGDQVALFELGKTYYILHDYVLAETMLRKLWEGGQGGDINTALLLGKTYKEIGRPDEALRVFEKALCSAGEQAEIMGELAELYKNCGHYEKAARIYEKMFDKSPRDYSLFAAAVQLYNSDGAYDAACAMASRISKDLPGADEQLKNRLLNEIEIAENKLVLESKPRILLVAITNRCNLKCSMCGRGSTPWDIPDKVLEEIISLLPCLELVTWQGGEVFLYNKFKTILKATVPYRNLKQIIITNGLMIDREWASLLAEHNNIDLTISIDSVNNDRYNKLRPGGRFNDLLNNLRIINEMRDEHRSSMTLTMRYTLMQDNYQEMGSIIEFAHAHRFDVVMICPIDESGKHGPHTENIFESDNRAALDYIAEMRERMHAEAARYRIRLLDWLPHNVEPCRPDREQQQGRQGCPMGEHEERKTVRSTSSSSLRASSYLPLPIKFLALSIRASLFMLDSSQFLWDTFVQAITVAP